MSSETASRSPLSVNEDSFVEYFTGKSFPEGREALALKKEKTKEHTALASTSSFKQGRH